MRILLFLIALAVNLPLPLLAVHLLRLNLVTNGIQQKLSCRGGIWRGYSVQDGRGAIGAIAAEEAEWVEFPAIPQQTVRRSRWAWTGRRTW